MFFINDNPADIQITLKKITKKRLRKEFEYKGYPFPSDLNKFSIIASYRKANLCYLYGSKPTVILELLLMELPINNWRLYLDE